MPQTKEEAMFFISAMEKVNEPGDWFKLGAIGALLIAFGLAFLLSLGVDNEVMVFAEIVIVLLVICVLAGLIHVLWEDTPEMKREQRQNKLSKKKKGEQ
jgi:hypothetical protein